MTKLLFSTLILIYSFSAFSYERKQIILFGHSPEDTRCSVHFEFNEASLGSDEEPLIVFFSYAHDIYDTYPGHFGGTVPSVDWRFNYIDKLALMVTSASNNSGLIISNENLNNWHTFNLKISGAESVADLKQIDKVSIQIKSKAVNDQEFKTFNCNF